MRIPITLYAYIARHFLMWISGIFVLFCAVIYVGDVIELTRRATAHPEATMPVLLRMALLQLPYTAQEVTPFAVLLGSIGTLWRMTRSQELIVARAAGVSVWQFLTPGIALAFLIGLIGITLFNPLASTCEASYKALDNTLLKNQQDPMVLTNSGLWLRQSDGAGTQAVVHAERLSQPEMIAGGVTVYFFRDGDRLSRRVDAASARLEEGRWLLSDAYDWRPSRGPEAEHLAELAVPTNLTVRKIEDSFASPETMSFWVLPSFIDLLEHSGFSAQRQRLYYQKLLSRPFLLCAMVLVAAIFSLRMQRRGGTTAMVIGGGAAGFLLYFLSDVVFALGTSAAIPVALAAWTPTGVSMLLGATFLLHLEDG